MAASAARTSSPRAPWAMAGSISSSAEKSPGDMAQPQALEPGRGQDDGVQPLGFELAQAGLDVAP